MIKINFNQKSAKTNASGSKGFASTGTSIVFTAITRALKGNQDAVDLGIIIKIVFNLVLVLSFPLGLKIYEIREINNLESIKNGEKIVLNKNQEKLNGLKKELEKYSYLQGLAGEFKDKRKFLSKIADDRLVVPRTIDFIQTQMTKDIWLTEMKIYLEGDPKKVFISGYGFKESRVNHFAHTLKGILNKKTISVTTQDVKRDGNNSIIKIKFQLEGHLI